jgi:hypothetical protein
MSDTNAETHQHDGAADAMATFTRNDDNTASTTQESTPRRYPLDPYLQDRRDSKAAASDLRCTQQFLESYRLSVLGRREPDARIQLAIMPSYNAALRKFQAVAHPSERGRRAFYFALRDMQRTLNLLQMEYERAHRARCYEMSRRHGLLMMPIPDRSRPVRVG